jgi:hypothetical protein
MCRILYSMIYHIYLSRSISLYKKFIYILYIYFLYIYIYTTFIYTLHLYIYYTIFSVGKCRNGLGSPKKIPIRLYFLQGRDIPFWYTSKIESGQNLLPRPDSTDSLSSQLRRKRRTWFWRNLTIETNESWSSRRWSNVMMLNDMWIWSKSSQSNSLNSIFFSFSRLKSMWLIRLICRSTNNVISRFCEKIIRIKCVNIKKESMF